MPKFVPVVDTEKPLAEQNDNDPNFQKHRHFDNPHALESGGVSKKTVDRGWQQGQVGWGVLKQFGNLEKDDAAQVIKRSVGAQKMVKNEKGLWVKAKELTKGSDSGANYQDQDGSGWFGSGSSPGQQHEYPLSHRTGDGGGGSSSIRGRGRGSGVPVLPQGISIGTTGTTGTAGMNNSSSSRATDSFGRSKAPADSERGQFADVDARNERFRESRDSIKDRDKTRERSRDSRERSSRKRSRDRGGDRDRDRVSRDKGRVGSRGYRGRSYSRSRSRSRAKHHRSDRDGHGRQHSSRREGSHRYDQYHDQGYKDRESDRDRDRRKSCSGSRYRSHGSSRDDSPKASRDDRHRGRERHERHGRAGKRHGGSESVQGDRDKEGRNRSISNISGAVMKDDCDDTDADSDDRRGDDSDGASVVDSVFSFTCIQVANRFHEVYAKETLFSANRLDAIMELFCPPPVSSNNCSSGSGEAETESQGASASGNSATRGTEASAATAIGPVIASLKTGAVYLQGAAAVRASFGKTRAAPVTVSKRMYVECAGIFPSTSSDSQCSTVLETDTAPVVAGAAAGETMIGGCVAGPVTYCLDLHRPGTAPGLGDPSKHTALLYRCRQSHFTHIWGMTDVEQLAADHELTQEQVLGSKVWRHARDIILRDYHDGGSVASGKAFDETAHAHYHNYDKMEVWGFG